jgi:hypothetical protein
MYDFHYHEKTQTYTAEISSLALDHLPNRIAMTEDGQAVIFVLVETCKQEGDILFWKYQSEKSPKTIVIFND